MQVRLDSPQYTSFGAINRKYLRKAHEQLEGYGNIVSWNRDMDYDINLFKRVSERDARDTVEVVENYVSSKSLPSYKQCFAHLYSLRQRSV